MRPCCWIERRALTELLSECSRWAFRETGGALLGWREAGEYVVARILGPGPRAKHGFTYFEPDSVWQVARGRETYRASGRTVAYLGDWHTHPRGAPNPSRRDQQTARQIAKDPSFRSPRPLYAIVGRPLRRILPRNAWDLAVYMWDEELVPVDIEIFDSDHPADDE